MNPFLFCTKFVLNEYALKIFTWIFIHEDFMSFPLRISKWHTSWQMTLKSFDISFNLDLGGLMGR